MASIQKTKKGYRIQYYNKGDRRSATFPARRKCIEWLADLVHKENTPPAKRITLGEMLSEYREKVTSQKKSQRAENVRSTALLNRFSDLMVMPIGNITKADIAIRDWGWLHVIRGVVYFLIPYQLDKKDSSFRCLYHHFGLFP